MRTRLISNGEVLERTSTALSAARVSLMRPSPETLPRIEEALETAQRALARFDSSRPDMADWVGRLGDLRRQLNEVTALLAGAMEFHRDRVFAVTEQTGYGVAGPLPVEAQAEALRPSHCCDVRG